MKVAAGGAPPRVAMVSRRVHPAHGPGGLERHVHDLVVELSRLGVPIDLFTETPPDLARRAAAETALTDRAGLRWVPPGPLPLGHRAGTVVLDRISNYFVWSRRVAAHLRSASAGRWQVVHAHGLGGWGPARDAGRGQGVAPLVTTMQGLEEFRSPRRLKRWAYAPFRQGLRTVARHSALVVTTDESLRPVMAEHLGLPVETQTVVPNAIDAARCRRLADPARARAVLEAVGLAGASPLLLSVGRIEANKGFVGLVEALARTATDLPRAWGWVLVGDGPERTRVEAAIRAAGLGDRCRLLGRRDDAELHGLYAAADWFVHPTLYEGSSLVTLEAMAHGLPVVATRTGGLPDKVEEGVSGFLVEPGAIDELSARLHALPAVDAVALGAAGRARCETAFAWTVVARRYLELYAQLRVGPDVGSRGS